MNIEQRPECLTNWSILYFGKENYFLIPSWNEKNFIYPWDREQNTKSFVVELPLWTLVSRELDLGIRTITFASIVSKNVSVFNFLWFTSSMFFYQTCH